MAASNRGPGRRLAGAALLLLLAAACAAIPETPGPPPSAFLPPEAEREWRTLRGPARLQVDGPGGGAAAQVVVLALPDRGRLETLSPLGTTMAVLVVAGGEIRFHSVVGREYAAGPATTETVQRLTGIPAPPAVLLRLLAGLPPLPVRMQDPRTRLDDVEGGRLLASVEGPLWQRIHLPAGVEPVRGELGDAGGLLLTFEWEALRAVEGALVPHTVRVAGAEAGVRLTLRYEWVRLGEGPDPSLFDLPQPSDPGIAVRELGSRPVFGAGR